jgi:hypothetical protein
MNFIHLYMYVCVWDNMEDEISILFFFFHLSGTELPLFCMGYELENLYMNQVSSYFDVQIINMNFVHLYMYVCVWDNIVDGISVLFFHLSGTFILHVLVK